MGRPRASRDSRHMGAARYVRLGLGGVGVGVVTVFLLFVDLGGTVAGSLDPVNAIVIAIWALPFVVYVVAVRSSVASVLGGLGLNAAALIVLVSLFRDTHSTAGIGLLTLPMLLALLAALVAALDSLGRKWARRPT